MSEHRHEVDGKPVGHLAEFISRLREQSGPQAADPVEVFENISYRNLSNDRSLPLHAVRLIGTTIRGLHLEGVWLNVDLIECDLSHIRGTVHLSGVTVERSDLRHFMVQVFASFSSFSRCRFERALMKRPVFMNCRFDRCSFESAVLIEPFFLNCEFNNVDLTNSRWEEPQRLSIRGTWKPVTLAEGSSSEARGILENGVSE